MDYEAPVGMSRYNVDCLSEIFQPNSNQGPAFTNRFADFVSKIPLDLWIAMYRTVVIESNAKRLTSMPKRVQIGPVSASEFLESKAEIKRRKLSP